MAPICGVGEQTTLPVGGPAEVIKVQVSQYDIRDFGWLHSQGRQVPHEPARPIWISVWTNSSVDDGETLTGPNEEPAHFDRQHSVVVQELGVL